MRQFAFFQNKWPTIFDAAAWAHGVVRFDFFGMRPAERA